MNALGVSIIEASLYSSASMIQDNNIALVATFGELESSLEMKSLFLFPLVMFLPLILPSLSYLEKM